MVATPPPSGFLCLPSPKDRTALRLRRKVRLLAVRTLLTAPTIGLPTAHVRALSAARAFVTDSLSTAPEEVLTAVGSPDVLPSLLAWASGAEAPERCLDAVPHLLARLTALGPATPLVWPGPIHSLSAHDAGPLWRPSAPTQAVLFARNQLEVQDASGPPRAWRDLGATGRTTPVAPSISLCTADTNPLAALEAHPDKQGNAVRLGGHPVEAWGTALGEALALIDLLPSWRGELDALGVRLLPVGFEPERHLSASYREAPGIVYLTLHPSRLTLAEALVHECQHGKLNLLTWLDPVLKNGQTTWTPSPVRPDLRPLMGVLLAAHAFVPVAALHVALEESDHPLTKTPTFGRRKAEVLSGNARALEILDRLAEPTPTGRRVLDALHALHTWAANRASASELEHQNLPPG